MKGQMMKLQPFIKNPVIHDYKNNLILRGTAKGKINNGLHPYFLNGTSGGSNKRKYFKIPEGFQDTLQIFARKECDCSGFKVRTRLLNNEEVEAEDNFNAELQWNKSLNQLTM